MRHVYTGSVVLGIALVAGAVLVGSAAGQDPRIGPGLSPALPRLPPPPPSPRSRDKPRTGAFSVGHIRHEKTGMATFQVMISSGEPGTTGPNFGLRVWILQTHPKSKNDEAVVKAADLPALMRALSAMERTIEAQFRGGDVTGSAMDYRFGSLGIGFASPESLYLMTGGHDPARLTLPLWDLGEIDTFVRRAARRIRELEAERETQRKKSG